MNEVRVRLHQPLVKKNGKVKIYPLYETGSADSRFLLNGSLKFEANKAGSFEFDILPSHPCYSIIRRYIHYVSVTINETEDLWPEDNDDGEAVIPFEDTGEVVFYGRIISISMAFNKVKHITCEGLLANLIDAPMFNDMSNDIGVLADYEKDEWKEITYEYPTDTPGKYRRKVIATELDDGKETKELYRITGDANIMWKKAGDAYRNILQRSDLLFSDASISSDNMDDIDVYGGESVCDFITSELIDVYGGFIKVEYGTTTDYTVNATVSWIKDPSMEGFSQEENGQPIEFGVNLLDLSAEFSEDNVVNGVCVAWTTKDDEKKWKVEEKESISSLPALKTILVPVHYGSTNAAVEFVEVPGISTQSKAASYAKAYRKKFCNYDFANEKFDRYTVKAIDRHYTDPDNYPEPIALYDQVRLVSSPHEVNDVFTCTSISYSINNPVSRSYTLEVFRPKPSSNEKVLSKQIGKKIKYKEVESGTTSDAKIEEFFRD